MYGPLPVPAADCFSGEDEVGSAADLLFPPGRTGVQSPGQHLQQSANIFMEYTAASAATRMPAIV